MTTHRLTPADLADVRGRTINLLSPDVGRLCAEVEAAWADAARLERERDEARALAADLSLLERRVDEQGAALRTHGSRLAAHGARIDQRIAGLEQERDRLAGTVRAAVERLKPMGELAVCLDGRVYDVGAAVRLLTAALAEGEG